MSRGRRTVIVVASIVLVAGLALVIFDRGSAIETVGEFSGDELAQITSAANRSLRPRILEGFSAASLRGIPGRVRDRWKNRIRRIERRNREFAAVFTGSSDKSTTNENFVCVFLKPKGWTVLPY